ncbi:PaaX family transcriptional regulator C-terminal domain-containing protein [Skermania sp. ID1734]|uniref:PaaX family transcriptional regulator n=1 Tax=Skermania sp. ID1734 TaxID=2597516 RepID=UPI0021068F51|nr:PaaX family transcriptional regulator C-terminal domain-containing protein [Skermania sp. ID1734]
MQPTALYAASASAEGAATANQPRRLIVTVYGLYARETENWLSVSSVVRLLRQLGVDEPAVRSSISRLKRRGTLVSENRDGVAGYALSESALRTIREGDRRIFHMTRATSDDGWLLAVFSIPETERDKRHEMRMILTRMGFGTTAPGVWIAPAHVHDEVADALRDSDLAQFVDLFHAEHLAFGDLRTKVSQWWDLDGLQELYSQFIAQFAPLREHLRRRRKLEAHDAFVAYVQMLTTWRRLPYLDPGLPLELLPKGWDGARAGELFEWLRQRLVEPAHAYARGVIEA